MFGFIFFLFFVSIVCLFIGLIKPTFVKMGDRKKALKVFGSAALIFFIISIIVVPDSTAEEAIGEVDEPEVEEVEEDGQNEESVEEEVEDYSEVLAFEGDLSVKQEDGKITLTVNTNAIDGSIFEMSVLNSEFDIGSDFVVVKDGTAEVTFDISSWDIGYISAMVNFPFNYEDNPQPNHIKEIYGEAGENLDGKFAKENNLDGKNASLDPLTVAYPDEETVAAQSQELFTEGIEEMKSLSEGIIVDIKPSFGDGDWKFVDVVVSDAWYHSQDYEKERFAEQVGSLIEQMVVNTGQADGSIQVYFKDSYNKEVAKPKLLGGYNIVN